MYNFTSVHVFQWLLGFTAVVVDQDSMYQHWDRFLFLQNYHSSLVSGQVFDQDMQFDLDPKNSRLWN